MNFLLQSEESKFDNDVSKLKEILDLKSSKFIHRYLSMSLESLKRNNGNIFRSFVPVGSIEFVSEWLNKFYEIDHMEPLEVPEALRTIKYLNRDYRIVNGADLPKEGNWFIKDITKMKTFSFCGNVEYMDGQDESHTFSVSDVLSIKSEWRVYVISGEIENCCNYNGDCMIFPDTGLIKEMIHIMNSDPLLPNSYTIDVAVLRDGKTCLIESHPFACIGLYGTLWPNSLPYAYEDGITYYLNFT